MLRTPFEIFDAAPPRGIIDTIELAGKTGLLGPKASAGVLVVKAKRTTKHAHQDDERQKEEERDGMLMMMDADGGVGSKL